MINPINFRASAAIAPVKSNEQEAPKTETSPIENKTSFKGAEAIANYNKAILAADTTAEETPKAPAFKGDETTVETEPKAV